MPNFRLVFDVSNENDDTTKIRYAWYLTQEEAIMQAEHELATEEAVQRHRDHYNNGDLELHPSGVRIIGVEDADGKVVWSPPS